MGCSNPHPHGQLWSLSAIPTLPAVELESLKQYSQKDIVTPSAPKAEGGKPCLLCDYAHVESSSTERLVYKNEHWIAVVPWWATWPFEVLCTSVPRKVKHTF